MYGDVYGCKCSIHVHPKSVFFTLDVHVAPLLEELNWGWGAKFGLHPQFSSPGGDALSCQKIYANK